jgi:hypothetical protein
MSDNTFNWSAIEKVINPQQARYEFETHKHLFKKVAFDTYKSINGNSVQLWELREAEDGNSYLYALYGEPEDIVSNSEQSSWEAISNGAGDNVTLSYKKIPIYRFASSVYPFQKESASQFANYVIEQTHKEGWVNDFLQNAAGMTDERRVAIRKLIQGD